MDDYFMLKMFKMVGALVVFIVTLAFLPQMFHLIVDTLNSASSAVSSNLEAPEKPSAQSEEEPAGEAVDEPAQEEKPALKEEAPQEAAPSESTNLTPLWVTLGVVGGVGVLAGTSATVSSQVSKRRRERAAEKAKEGRLLKRWKSAAAKHSLVAQEYSEYLMDLSEIFKRPALSDASVSLTAAFLEVYTILGAPDPEPVKHLDEKEVVRYEELTSKALSAWRAANANAIRLGLGSFTSEERRKVERAQSLLAMALDPGASEFERATAYQQVKKLVEGLIQIPQAALTQIEAGLQLAITSGRRSTEKGAVNV